MLLVYALLNYWPSPCYKSCTHWNSFYLHVNILYLPCTFYRQTSGHWGIVQWHRWLLVLAGFNYIPVWLGQVSSLIFTSSLKCFTSKEFSDFKFFITGFCLFPLPRIPTPHKCLLTLAIDPDFYGCKKDYTFHREFVFGW